MPDALSASHAMQVTIIPPFSRTVSPTRTVRMYSVVVRSGKLSHRIVKSRDFL